MDWLDSFNRDRMGTALEHMLRVSWESLVRPKLVDRTEKVNSASSRVVGSEETSSSSSLRSRQARRPMSSAAGTLEVQQGAVSKNQMHLETESQSVRSHDSCPEGVDSGVGRSGLVEKCAESSDLSLPLFSPQKGSLTQSISLHYKRLTKSRTSAQAEPKLTESPLNSSTCPETLISTHSVLESTNDTPSKPYRTSNETDSVSKFASNCSQSVCLRIVDDSSASEKLCFGACVDTDLLNYNRAHSGSLPDDEARSASTDRAEDADAMISSVGLGSKIVELVSSRDDSGVCISLRPDRGLSDLQPVPATENTQQVEYTKNHSHGEFKDQTDFVFTPSSCNEVQTHASTQTQPKEDFIIGSDASLTSGKKSCDHLKMVVSGGKQDPPGLSTPFSGEGKRPGTGQGQVTGSMECDSKTAGLESGGTEQQTVESELQGGVGCSQSSGHCDLAMYAGQTVFTTQTTLLTASMAAASNNRQVKEQHEAGSVQESGSTGEVPALDQRCAAAVESGEPDENSQVRGGHISPDNITSLARSGSLYCSSPSQSVRRTSLGGQHICCTLPLCPGPPRSGRSSPAAAAVQGMQLGGCMGQVQVQNLQEQDEESKKFSLEGNPQTCTESHKGARQGEEEELDEGQGPDAGGSEEPAVVKPQDPMSIWPLFSKTQSTIAEVQKINADLLESAVLCLPGTRDKCGRALVTVTTRHTIWSNPKCNSDGLAHILMYFYSIIRKDVRALGLTVLVDARHCSPAPPLFTTFSSLQDAIPGCIHAVLLLVDRDLTFHIEKPSAIQFEQLTSLKSLHKLVDGSQLPSEFGGTFSFCYNSWISFRTRVEQLAGSCQGAILLLRTTISSMKAFPLPATAEEAQELLCSHRELMRSVLEDSRLLRLQLEGGAALSRLRKEESSISVTEDYRDAVEAVSTMYEQVDEQVHELVTLSNKRSQQLEFIVDFKNLEEGFTEVRRWIETVGERQLSSLSKPKESLEQLHRQQALFREFYSAACEHRKHGEALLQKLERWDHVASEELHSYQDKVCSFWSLLRDFYQRVEDTKSAVEKTVKLYEFFDRAYKWALEGMHHLACITMEDCGVPAKCHAVITCLEGYQQQHPEIPDDTFQEMKQLALDLKNASGLKQWKFAWSKCQETKQMFKKKLEMAVKTRQSLPPDRSREAYKGQSGLRQSSGGAAHRQNQVLSSSSMSYKQVFSGEQYRERKEVPGYMRAYSPVSGRRSTDEDCGVHKGPSSQSLGPLTAQSSQDTPLKALPTPTKAGPHSPWQPALRLGRRVLRKTRSFDVSGGTEPLWNGTYHRTLSEPVRHGNTGVFIKGLEVSSTEVADRSFIVRLPVRGWISAGAPKFSTPTEEARVKGSKLHHIVDEMVVTEREYVRSLRYVIEQYFPEMERVDLPQDLRGKRTIIFGNLEKLADFHSQYFLQELESCCNHPLRVSHCFLRHQDQFGLYALYSKNKPKSDALLATHGNTFFKNKQLELGDKMDLASYLLKPIQRMSKYALLLKDLIKEVNESQEQELASLRAAAEMVKFQLRHGNDLLAMDAIRDCDVNLKEQGQLVRQDEFSISYGRRKCQRHVFLFEDLILFSKPKRIEGGLDVYVYKHSFKTADVGMTETSGDNKLRFEIWFRRRISKSQTYILQAGTMEVKQAWTSDIARILWQQATRNKEIRMQEMVSMGVGNKPFLDIKPSEAAINDRAIDYIMKDRANIRPRTRASIAVSLFDHSNPFDREQVSIPEVDAQQADQPSSSSLLGSLNLHMYCSQGRRAREPPFISPCIEEDEQEHETSSQPSMTTESSESSSHCLSAAGSSGSDSGCVSSHLPEGLSEGSGSPSEPSGHNCMTLPMEGKACLHDKPIPVTAGTIMSPSTVV